MPEPSETSPPRPSIDPEVVRQVSQYAKTWQGISAKIDFSWMNSMFLDQASISRQVAQLNESLRPSQDLMRRVAQLNEFIRPSQDLISRMAELNEFIRPSQDLISRMAELNEFIRPSRELIAQISRAIGVVDWGAIRRGLAKALPSNWGRLSDLPSWEKLPEVAFDDGIPIAWVPRQELVEELLSAGGRPERIQLLIEHEAEILADCAACLEQCTEPALADDVILAKQALRAFQDGHQEVAQSHAALIANGRITAIVEAYAPGASTYPAARKLAQFDLEVGLSEFRSRATLAPVNAFYSRWDGRQGGPVPDALNRFVLGHGPRLNHFRTDNALLAMMLVTSLLRELQEQLAPAVDQSDQEPAA